MKGTLSFIDKVFIGILLVVFGGIVLHAPLTIAFSTVLPDYSLVIKSWKEILLGAGLLLAVAILTMRRQWRTLHTPLFYCIAGFTALNLLLIPFYFNGFEATVAGLFINLRFLLFFVLVYVALRLYPQLYRLFLTVFVAGALVVVVFAVLQSTILPHDILKYIGYNQSTIMPFLTVDQNMDYIRINSTLRGPNPLGAYAVIVLAVALAGWLNGPKNLKKWELYIVLILGAGSVVALWASYSRSAALAALAAVGLVLLVAYGRQLTKITWLVFGVVALVLCGSMVALKDTQFVSQVILHEDPSEGNNVNSNDGHAESLYDGTIRMISQPLGAGVGSTGSASLLSDEPVIIENQYLFVAHETGWPGLALFLVINYFVLEALWARRKHWLSLAVFASGIGLAIAGLVLPVWVDDTVSIVWWGLAAICLAIPMVKASREAAQKTSQKNAAKKPRKASK